VRQGWITRWTSWRTPPRRSTRCCRTGWPPRCVPPGVAPRSGRTRRNGRGPGSAIPSGHGSGGRAPPGQPENETPFRCVRDRTPASVALLYPFRPCSTVRESATTGRYLSVDTEVVRIDRKDLDRWPRIFVTPMGSPSNAPCRRARMRGSGSRPRVASRTRGRLPPHAGAAPRSNRARRGRAPRPGRLRGDRARRGQRQARMPAPVPAGGTQ
jgi:hypothetical protein